VEIGKELPRKAYMLVGNYSAASQVKSNNTPRIVRKPQNGICEFPLSVMEVHYVAL